MSANSAREPLKPVVLALAMLLAMTLRSDWAALMPLSAVLSAMFYSSLEWTRDASENLCHLAERHTAHARYLQVRAHRAAAVSHTRHRAGDIGIEGCGATGGLERVRASGNGIAVVVLPVPAELLETRALRAHRNIADHVAGTI